MNFPGISNISKRNFPDLPEYLSSLSDPKKVLSRSVSGISSCFAEVWVYNIKYRIIVKWTSVGST